MDLFICSLNLKTKVLHCAGAYNPLYIVREKQLTEFKGDKIHIGSSNTEKNQFTLHEFEMQENDIIYCFTDGFADQKGGAKNKKFYYPPFRKLLSEVSGLEMNKQREVLYSSFKEWKGN